MLLLTDYLIELLVMLNFNRSGEIFELHWIDLDRRPTLKLHHQDSQVENYHVLSHHIVCTALLSHVDHLLYLFTTNETSDSYR